MGRRRSPASAAGPAAKPASGPDGRSAPTAGTALASATAGDWAGADWAEAGLGLATRRWGSEDGWVRTGGADACDGLASAGDCGKADGGLSSAGWLKAEGELIPSD